MKNIRKPKKMWNQKNILRHTYLQSNVKIMNPTTINEAVDYTMKTHKTFWASKKDFPKDFKILPLVPRHFGIQAEKQKARLSYGHQGLPNIIRQLTFYSTLGPALKTLIDLLYNPYECCRAVNDYHIVKRLEDVLFKILPENRKNQEIVGAILKCFSLIAVQQVGAIKIMKQFNIVDTFYEMILCGCAVSCRCIQVLLRLSSLPLIAEEMIHYNHLEKLKIIFDNIRSCRGMKHLYVHLANLIAIAPAKAVQIGYFELLLPLVEEASQFQTIIIKCLALLLNCENGQISFDQNDGIRILYKLLISDSLKKDTLQYVALAFQNATISRRSMWRCHEFWDLPLLLIRFAYDKENIHLQNYSIQTLRNITSMPSVKNFVRRTCKQKIVRIPCRSDHTRFLRDKLINWLRKKPYMNVDDDNIAECDRQIQNF